MTTKGMWVKEREVREGRAEYEFRLRQGEIQPTHDSCAQLFDLLGHARRKTTIKRVHRPAPFFGCPTSPTTATIVPVHRWSSLNPAHLHRRAAPQVSHTCLVRGDMHQPGS
jgi:hypothetical protein